MCDLLKHIVTNSDKQLYNRIISKVICFSGLLLAEYCDLFALISRTVHLSSDVMSQLD